MNKKFIGFAALALTVMVTSCSKNEMTESFGNGTTSELAFKAVTPKPLSRAAETVLGDLETAGVPVYAYYHDGTNYTSYFTETLSYSAVTGWNPSVKRYLKDGYTNVFYSVYPAQAVSASTVAGGVKIVDYTANGTTDLLGAAGTGTYTLSTDGTGVSVPLTFNHLLAQVNFGVKIDNTATTGVGDVVITNISFNNVGAKGTYTFGTEGIGVPSNWTADATASTANFAMTGATINTKDDVHTAAKYDQQTNYATPYWVLDRATSSKMPMPLAFTAASTITFQFQAYDKAGVEITNGATAATINLQNTTAWNQGLRYVYIVDFETNYFNNREIIFEVYCSDWENYDWASVPAAGTGIVTVESDPFVVNP